MDSSQIPLASPRRVVRCTLNPLAMLRRYPTAEVPTARAPRAAMRATPAGAALELLHGGRDSARPDPTRIRPRRGEAEGRNDRWNNVAEVVPCRAVLRSDASILQLDATSRATSFRSGPALTSHHMHQRVVRLGSVRFGPLPSPRALSLLRRHLFLHPVLRAELSVLSFGVSHADFKERSISDVSFFPIGGSETVPGLSTPKKLNDISLKSWGIPFACFPVVKFSSVIRYMYVQK